ncbi:MAG: carboxypeptidase regulatory-like domain-containing protein [Candidatus Omnitrophica bacterium]|nr:carboxypeptidase regulatory-like domain-containing protein [Candidatus Omnitrophota bacterium]
MTRCSRIAPALIAILVAIGCGSSKPQDASATTEGQAASSAPAQAAQASAGQPAATGSASIQGTVRLNGTAPAAEKVKMDADPVCQQQHASPVYTEDVVADANGGLKHVFVYVKEGAKGPFPVPTQPVVLNQQGCWYTPRVLGIQVNQPFEIVNSDGTLHNINAKPGVNPPFNIAQPVKGMKTTKKFTKPEIGVTFKCNVHPWMRAFAGVVEHPFFGVSGADGAFTIAGLPAGTYVIEAWHEQYGTKTQTISVGDGETTSLEFTFTAQ